MSKSRHIENIEEDAVSYTVHVDIVTVERTKKDVTTHNPSINVSDDVRKDAEGAPGPWGV